MLNINNILIAGGHFRGCQRWSKEASNLDKCFKIYQMEQGTAFLCSKTEKYKLEEGGIYFINGFRIKSQNCPQSFTVNWLHFISDSIFIKQALMHFPLVTQLNTKGLGDLNAEFARFESFFSEYSSTQKSINRNELVSYFNIQALLLRIISKLAENSDIETFHLSGQRSRLLKAIEYIDANYKNTVTLKQLAGLCFMSENYFHNLFKKEFTVTPNNYILQLRMNEALNLLSNTNLAVKEVARECGYFDAAYFSRTFSNYFGLSPNKYRSLHNTRTP